MTIVDVGEILPDAKKHLSKKSKNKTTSKNSTRLRQLWEEPKWEQLFSLGYDKKVLQLTYVIYHSLRKYPVRHSWSFDGIKVSAGDWSKEYDEQIELIRDFCLDSSSDEMLLELQKILNSKAKWQQYAVAEAGDKHLRTLFPINGKGENMMKLMPYIDFPGRAIPKKITLFPIKFKNKETNENYFRLCKDNRKSVSWENHTSYDKFSTYADAANALITFHGDKFIKPESVKGKPYLPKKDLTKLRGVDQSIGDVTAIELMETFGFRGVQFGNYLSNKDRQLFLNNVYDSLDLITGGMLKINPVWIGGKKLGIAFGARGGGQAAAHYEPSSHIINLTKHQGPGCIAHELFHSIDQRLCKKYFGVNELLSDFYWANKEYAISKIGDESMFVSLKPIIDECCKPSSYVKNADNLNGQKGGQKYWNKPSELVARAFEAWVQDSLIEHDVIQDWAAFGTLEADYDNNNMHPYPCEEDRERINQCFKDNLENVFKMTK